jgi:CubicO group peptidase (beta-lactamase class C family)
MASDPIDLLTGYLDRDEAVGVQLVAWHRDELVLDHSAGWARPGVPMMATTPVRLDCAVKPLLSLTLAVLAGAGELAPHDPVSRYLPGFGTGGKAGITLHHLLTHTSGLPVPEEVAPYRTDLDTLRRYLHGRPVAAEPGSVIRYDPWGGWYVLADVASRVGGAPWYELATRAVLDPLGIRPHLLVDDRERVELPYKSVRGRLFPLRHYDRPDALRYENPAFGGYASMAEWAELFRILGSPGRCRDQLGVDPGWCTRVQRERGYDVALRMDCAVGYGMLVGLADWNFSPHVSPVAFGHHSDSGTWALCDPARRLAVGLRVNGLPRDLHPHPGLNPHGNPVLTAVYQTLET